MRSLKQFFSKGLALFTTTKRHRGRKNRTRRHKKRHSRRRGMRGGWGESFVPSDKAIYKGGIMKGGWGGAVPTNVQIQ